MINGVHTLQYRRLGQTDLDVSCLALGTVGLGIDYGIPAPGAFGRPEPHEAIRLLQTAADAGINLFDTAPSYGISEELLGTALARRSDCYFATKVGVPTCGGKPASGRALAQGIESSLTRSLRSLRRETLDIVQIHNATVEVIESGEIAAALEAARDQGYVRFLGASVYGEEAALAAVRAGCFHVIQVAYNLLDQRMAADVFCASRAPRVGILARSPLLKGALSVRARWLPPELKRLTSAVQRVRRELGVSWDELPVAALRFCLSSPHVESVIFGPRTTEELRLALDAVMLGPYDAARLARATGVALGSDPMLNPSTWALP